MGRNSGLCGARIGLLWIVNIPVSESNLADVFLAVIVVAAVIVVVAGIVVVVIGINASGRDNSTGSCFFLLLLLLFFPAGLDGSSGGLLRGAGIAVSTSSGSTGSSSTTTTASSSFFFFVMSTLNASALSSPGGGSGAFRRGIETMNFGDCSFPSAGGGTSFGIGVFFRRLRRAWLGSIRLSTVAGGEDVGVRRTVLDPSFLLVSMNSPSGSASDFRRRLGFRFLGGGCSVSEREVGVGARREGGPRCLPGGVSEVERRGREGYVFVG